MKSTSELDVLLGGALIGRVTWDSRHRFRFTYDPAWRAAGHAIPLSLSMPLAASEHGHAPIEAFMWGLLPDNGQVLDRWAHQFHVSTRNPFALLSKVGEDCAGAVQFVVPERLEQLVGPGPLHVQWLTEHDVAERLRALRADLTAWRLAGDTGQFSLAGAQAKTALFFDGGRWGMPAGRTPTTHILKPSIAGLDGHAENEHLCLSLARELGLPTATSQVLRFEDETAVVVERYDRYRTAALGELAKTQPLLRLHQEDLCQAMGVLPVQKYQNEGGPAPQAIVQLLRAQSNRPTEDVGTFVDALIYNWLIAGTDAHAKNYSLLFGSRAQVRLAPLYDLGSALPYRDMDQRRLTLAMKIGHTYHVREVTPRQLGLLAVELELDAKSVLLRAEELAARARERIAIVREREKAAGLVHPIVDRLSEHIAEHASSCQNVLASARA